MNAPNAENIHRLALDALVCGYSSRYRDGRLIGMWQAYIDDSGHRDHAPVMVLAGFIATVPQWKVFSDEWQQMLDMSPGIKYFKMNEAFRADGQFLDWSRERINERVRQAYKVIEATKIPFQASVIVRLDDFYDIFTEEFYKKSAINPYYLANREIIRHFAYHQLELGINDPVDFIFDRQVMEEEKIRASWDRIKTQADPAIRPLLGNKPEFKDDNQLLPLQAADLAAWWIREMATKEYGPNAQAVDLPWKSNRNILGIQVHYDRKRLEEAHANMIARLAAMPSSDEDRL